MTTVLLGLATALSYGFADFFGAIASRKVKPVIVTALASFTGLILLLLVTPIFGADFSEGAVIYGVTGGVASAFALTCLYAALALGPISIVSPATALISALIPMFVGIANGEELGALSWVALLLILVAVVLVGLVPGADVRLPSLPAMLYSVGAGVGIGFVLILIDASPADSGLAPIILLRLVGGLILVLLGAWLFWRTRTLLVTKGERIGRSVVLTILATGLLDSMANVLFILATRSGELAVVAVLTALYPAGTILLARFILKERLARSQSIGIALALSASVMLALS